MSRVAIAWLLISSLEAPQDSASSEGKGLSNVPTLVDLTNPNLMPWVDEHMKKIILLQTPKEVWMWFSGDMQVRRVYFDVARSANPKPSGYGESLGHYEGDTLVADKCGY
jgi:hypothetical protein